MSLPFSYHVDRAFPVGLVRLCGTLDHASTGHARTVLNQCLADQPTVLVVDLAELDVADDEALKLLPAVAQRALDWPGAAVFLCAARPVLTAALGRHPLASSVPHYPDRAQALAEAERRPVPPRVRQIYRPARDAAQLARSLVSRVCAAWRLPGIAPTAQLVASELVANAVLHARTLFEFSVMLRSPDLCLSVRDGGGGQVELGPVPPENAEHGRGLLVIDALASAWGTIRTGDGKVVWVTLRTTPDGPE